MECSWGKTGFSFAFDGIYNYGEGIANLGTYLPMEAPERSRSRRPTRKRRLRRRMRRTMPHRTFPSPAQSRHRAYSAVPWFHFAANPLSVPCWCGDWLMVRGGSFVVAVDLAGRRYAQLPLEEGSGDYNDFLASTHVHAGRHLLQRGLHPHRRRAAEALPRPHLEPAA